VHNPVDVHVHRAARAIRDDARGADLTLRFDPGDDETDPDDQYRHDDTYQQAR
jgi:hypothetical protein